MLGVQRSKLTGNLASEIEKSLVGEQFSERKPEGTSSRRISDFPPKCLRQEFCADANLIFGCLQMQPLPVSVITVNRHRNRPSEGESKRKADPGNVCPVTALQGRQDSGSRNFAASIEFTASGVCRTHAR